MKKFLVITAMIAVCSTASAQFTNSSAGGSSTSVQSDGWSTIYVQYNPIKIEDAGFTGFSIGYNKAFSISQSTPIYIEAGVGLTYAWYSDEYEDDYYDGSVETKMNMLSLKVPVSIFYDFQIPNSSISIYPFAGVTLRYNLSGKYKVEYSGEIGDYVEGVDSDIFDEDDMGEGAAYKRFQIGWQIGVNARFNNKFLVGVSYGSDFSEIAENTKLSTTSITLGYCF